MRPPVVARTTAGIERARTCGRRIGRRPAGGDVEAAVRTLRSRGMGMDRIARELGIGKSVAQLVCREIDHERSRTASGS